MSFAPKTTERTRRPRLTRKRIDGLQLAADLAESSVWSQTIDKPVLETAIQWIRDLGRATSHNSTLSKEACHGNDRRRRRSPRR